MSWRLWLGFSILALTVVMTVVAFLTSLGESLQYITFISHVALILTAIDIIWSSRANERLEENQPDSPEAGPESRAVDAGHNQD